MYAMKCLAKRSLAYPNHVAQSRNMERFVYAFESQNLCLLHEIAARFSAPRGGSFRHGCDPPVNSHRTNLCIARANFAPDNTRLRSGDIVPWGNR
jgi:hypothetical protein